MVSKTLVVCLLGMLVAAFAAAGSEEGVVVLTDETFERVHEGVWFVKMYMPWCPHCKELTPTWAKLAQRTEGRFHVAEVNCETDKEACAGVEAYPTMLLYVPGEAEPLSYEGDRTVDELEAFVEERAALDDADEPGVADGPASAAAVAAAFRSAEKAAARAKKAVAALQVAVARGENALQAEEQREQARYEAERLQHSRVARLTAQTFDRVRRGVWFVRMYAPWCHHCKVITPTWDKLAERAGDEFHVAELDCTKNEAVCDAENVTGYPTLYLYIEGTTGPIEYLGPRTVDYMVNFVRDNANTVHDDFDNTPPSSPQKEDVKDEL